MNLLTKLIEALIFVRKCIYYESYKQENKNETNSLIIPCLLIGVIDSPLFFGVLLLAEPIFVSDSIVRNIYPSSIASLYSIAWFILVATIELTYYRLGKNDIRIIRSFEHFSSKQLIRVKTIALGYALFSLIGGVVLIYNIW